MNKSKAKAQLNKPKVEGQVDKPKAKGQSNKQLTAKKVREEANKEVNKVPSMITTKRKMSNGTAAPRNSNGVANKSSVNSRLAHPVVA